jgi:hypothetical protein
MLMALNCVTINEIGRNLQHQPGKDLSIIKDLRLIKIKIIPKSSLG